MIRLRQKLILFKRILSSPWWKVYSSIVALAFYMKKQPYFLVAIATFAFIYLLNWGNIVQYEGKNNSGSAIAQTQRLTPEIIANSIYEQIPELPKENYYLSSNTGEIATQNTLISRLVRYHQFVKSRPVAFRLDWKLTLADYLGYNEAMRAENYPGFSTLTQNPFSQDREIIQNLTREKRDQLIDTLAQIHQPSPQPSSTPEEKPEQPSPSPSFVLPRQGGADLLMP